MSMEREGGSSRGGARRRVSGWGDRWRLGGGRRRLSPQRGLP